MLASLYSLRRLQVTCSVNQPGQTPYWAQLTALTELTVRYHNLEAETVVPGLGGMAGLRKLTIHCASFEDLPAGPYLSRLTSLSFKHCTFRAGVLASLSAATQLRHLDLECGNVGIRLTAADVALLRSQPVLTVLRLSKPADVKQRAWEESMAQLQGA